MGQPIKTHAGICYLDNYSQSFLHGTHTTVYTGDYFEKNLTTGEATSYYFFAGQRIALRNGKGVFWIYTDMLGSASLLTNASGGVVSQARYKPFGETRSELSVAFTDRKFTGYAREDAIGGIDFAQARYYDGVIGRFLSADTIYDGGLADPQGLNRYSYVKGRVMNATDPTGHWLDHIGERHTPTPPPPSFTNQRSRQGAPSPFATPTPSFGNSGGSGASIFPAPAIGPFGPTIATQGQQQAQITASASPINIASRLSGCLMVMQCNYNTTTVAITPLTMLAPGSPSIGFSVSIAVARRGGVYVSYGPTIAIGGLGPLTVSNSDGQIAEGSGPNGSTPSSKTFLKGSSMNVTGGILFTLGSTNSVGSGSSGEAGIAFPRAGLSFTLGRTLFKADDDGFEVYP